MIDENMVERVARACWEAEWEEPFPAPGGIQHAIAMKIARAAIEEIQLHCREAFVDTIPIVDIADIDRVD